MHTTNEIKNDYRSQALRTLAKAKANEKGKKFERSTSIEGYGNIPRGYAFKAIK